MNKLDKSEIIYKKVTTKLKGNEMFLYSLLLRGSKFGTSSVTESKVNSLVFQTGFKTLLGHFISGTDWLPSDGHCKVYNVW